MRETGTIKFYNFARGFGFIERGGGGTELYLHATALRDPSSKVNLWDGIQVEFTVRENRSGRPSALDVVVLG